MKKFRCPKCQTVWDEQMAELLEGFWGIGNKRFCQNCGKYFEMEEIKDSRISIIGQSRMNPVKEIKKIAKEIEKLSQGKDHVKLMRVDTLVELDSWARNAGWDGVEDLAKELRLDSSELIGYYVDLYEEEITDDELARATSETINPILVIVHGRLFDESKKGLMSSDGKYAYLTSEAFESLF